MDARSLVAVAVVVGVVACGGASDPAGEGGGPTSTSVETGGAGGAGGSGAVGASGGASSGPACGDGQCDPGESPSTCPADCHCGNGSCEFTENNANCAIDCFCGDDRCDSYEDEANCAIDCCMPTVTVRCGEFDCDLATEFCVANDDPLPELDSHECSPLPANCEDDPDCLCTAAIEAQICHGTCHVDDCGYSVSCVVSSGS